VLSDSRVNTTQLICATFPKVRELERFLNSNSDPEGHSRSFLSCTISEIISYFSRIEEVT